MVSRKPQTLLEDVTDSESHPTRGELNPEPAFSLRA